MIGEGDNGEHCRNIYQQNVEADARGAAGRLTPCWFGLVYRPVPEKNLGILELTKYTTLV